MIDVLIFFVGNSESFLFESACYGTCDFTGKIAGIDVLGDGARGCDHNYPPPLTGQQVVRTVAEL